MIQVARQEGMIAALMQIVGSDGVDMSDLPLFPYASIVFIYFL